MSSHRKRPYLDLPIGPVAIKPEAAALVDSVARDVTAGALQMQHVPDCVCVMPDRMNMACVQLTISSVAPDKCADRGGPGMEPNPCTAPGSLPRCRLCPKSPTYWRLTAGPAVADPWDGRQR